MALAFELIRYVTQVLMILTLVLDDPVVFVNEEVGKPNHAVQVREGEEVQLSCYVNGNPNPNITLSKESGDSRILQRETNDWLNHTMKSSQCSDLGTYKCTGTSTVFTKREKTFEINVTCKLFITSYFFKHKF